VQGAARQHGGRAVKLLGDGVMFHFPDPPGALRCSLELVERAPSEGLPPAHVGVHAGAVVYREGDYFGRTVNVAARVAAKAGPHQVLVTEDVLRTVPDGEAAYTSLGPVELKGVAAPVTLYHATRTGS
jgi:adenylate cyclase